MRAPSTGLLVVRVESADNSNSPMAGLATGADMSQCTPAFVPPRGLRATPSRHWPALRFRYLLAQPRRPNCSVKGTSCASAQAAPYLEL
jgi:hypothetical protein